MTTHGSFAVSVGDGTYLDFGWRDIREGWTLSDKEDGVQWFYNGPMQEQHIPALLQKFGLHEVFRGKPSPAFEKLRYLSPAELIAMRRKWEKKHEQERLAAVCDLNGARVSAEAVVGLKTAA
jgi:hypothetical protein